MSSEASMWPEGWRWEIYGFINRLLCLKVLLQIKISIWYETFYNCHICEQLNKTHLNKTTDKNISTNSPIIIFSTFKKIHKFWTIHYNISRFSFSFVHSEGDFDNWNFVCVHLIFSRTCDWLIIFIFYWLEK